MLGCVFGEIPQHLTPPRIYRFHPNQKSVYNIRKELTCKGGEVTGETSLVITTIGYQFRGQAISDVISYEDKWAYNEFTTDDLEFDAAASAVTITAKAQTICNAN